MLEKLTGLVPASIIDDLKNYPKLHTSNRLSHLLAQIKHESGAFKLIEENMNYSSKRLMEVFPRYFPQNLSESYGGKPELIANRVYGSRMGNGDEKSGDGWKYRGRGYMHLTGKTNYSAFSKWIGDPNVITNPDLVKTKYPFISAIWFWESNNLSGIADGGVSDLTINAITKRINGGTNGLAERKKYTIEFYSKLK